MTGEPKPDEPDFLDDFILEDVPAGKDLESLFDSPAAGATPPATAAAAPQGEAEAGEDALFTDHTQGLAPSEKFEGGPPFSETGSSTWKGEALELETPGTPVAGKRGTGGERDAAPAADGAEAAFPAELDSLLHGEDEFSIETDQELQIDETDDSLLDAAATSGETFVLDEGASAEPSETGAEAAESDGADAGEQMPLEVAAEDEAVEPGWEPLPGTSMDQLSEVGGVERTEGEGAEPEEWQEAAAEAEAGGDIYAEGVAEPAGVVGGRRRVPVLRLVASLAASLAIVGSAALFVWKPEWLGLHTESEQVASVQVQRPRLEIAVGAPPMPLPDADPADPTGTGTSPTPGTTVNGTPSVVTTEPPPVVPTPIETPEPVPSTTTPVVANGPEVPTVVNVPAPVDAQKDWPVPVAAGNPTTSPLPVGPGMREGLVRIGEDMLVGNEPDATALPVDGVMPGSKAFAQLHNGNYFIGSVKATDPECVTLRLATGEITLKRAGLAKLTPLGSTDYEELQRVTSGFVRLTNNNRLVGSILSSIADDHIVLEFRSNRVMLPKSAIGEVVQGEGEGGVRLGTTREEDDWVRQLSERQLGTIRPDLPNTGTGAATGTGPGTGTRTGPGTGTDTGHAAPPAPQRGGK